MKFFQPFQLEKSMVQRIKIAQQTPQEGLSTRGVSSPNEPKWLRLLCLNLVVMRCQPLRRALVSLRKNHQKLTHKVLKILHFAFKLHNLVSIWFFSDANLVESVESSAVSKSLITNKLR
ncbi:hypothetical protein [Vibrio metoecus]|uniref:hypothetical protein n=1 Tax=Vibrio metoecus TaxID=1481663 RepID=UPI0030B92C8F